MMRLADVEELQMALEDFMGKQSSGDNGPVASQIKYHVATLQSNLSDLLEKGATFA